MAKRLLPAAAFIAILAILYLCPLGNGRVENALVEGLRTAQVFVQQNLLYALLPALALAAVISVSIDKQAVVRQMSSTANRAVAYTVASVSGSVLSVCSCSVLPLFAGIRRMGAGLGPAITFLYAGPAINILAIVLTGRMLGWQIGLARGVCAVVLGVVVGGVMGLIFGRQENAPAALATTDTPPAPSLRRVSALVAALLAIVVFLTWSPSGFAGVLRCCPGGKTSSDVAGQVVRRTDQTLTLRDRSGAEQTIDASLLDHSQLDSPLNQRIYEHRFILAGLAGVALLCIVGLWFTRRDLKQWASEAWLLGWQIAPLFLAGVFISGLMLGRPGKEGLIPSDWITHAVGGNSIGANAAAAAVGAFMYFATITEVPVVQGLISSGMGHGPALAMLLAGPAIPGLMVLSALMGWRRTAAYTIMVIATATLAGAVFGAFYP